MLENRILIARSNCTSMPNGLAMNLVTSIVNIDYQCWRETIPVSCVKTFGYFMYLYLQWLQRSQPKTNDLTVAQYVFVVCTNIQGDWLCLLTELLFNCIAILIVQIVTND